MGEIRQSEEVESYCVEHKTIISREKALILSSSSSTINFEFVILALTIDQSITRSIY